MSTVKDFVDQLKQWGQRETGEHRVAMADLRRGLQEFPRLAPYMHRYIAPYTAFISRKEAWDKQTYYLVAALFARYHSGSKEPRYAKYGNMGSHFASALEEDQNAGDAIERRFNALLTAHPQDLHYHLRQAIAFLHGKTETTIPINWERLFWDIKSWGDDEKRPEVQEKWAASFWRRKAKVEKEQVTNSENN